MGVCNPADHVQQNYTVAWRTASPFSTRWFLSIAQWCLSIARMAAIGCLRKKIDLHYLQIL